MKFALRNLKNEKRRLEKLLKKVNREIHDIENAEELTRGKVAVDTRVLTTGTYKVNGKKTVDFNMVSTRYGRDIVCELTLKDSILGVDIKEKFIGIATCATDDEFDASVGINLALNRALQEFYLWVEESYSI